MQDKLVWAFASGLTEQASKVIRAKAGLLGESGQREILVEMREYEVGYPAHLRARQSLCGGLFEISANGRIVAQKVNGEHLGRGLGIEFAGEGGLLQFTPEREANLC